MRTSDSKLPAPGHHTQPAAPHLNRDRAPAAEDMAGFRVDGELDLTAAPSWPPHCHVDGQQKGPLR